MQYYDIDAGRQDDTEEGTMVNADYIMEHQGAFTLVDVRTPEEFAYGHIPNAVNIPYAPDFAITDKATSRQPQAFEKAGIGKDEALVLYCHMGPRAEAAAQALVAAGYANVEVYPGGWADWTSDPSRPAE